jgi:uncharacterized protein YbjT (DUF2867 family)
MILVTGGIGSELLRLLSQAGVGARARACPQPAKSAETAWHHMGCRRSVKTRNTDDGFPGVKTLFLNTSYYEGMVALQHNAIAAASAAGVTHVVKVSAFAASDHSRAPIGRWHH